MTDTYLHTSFTFKRLESLDEDSSLRCAALTTMQAGGPQPQVSGLLKRHACLLFFVAMPCSTQRADSFRLKNLISAAVAPNHGVHTRAVQISNVHLNPRLEPAPLRKRPPWVETECSIP